MSIEQVDALVDELLASCDPAAVPPEEFLGRQFDLGLAWVHFPVGHGGLGVAPSLQALVDDRLAAVGAPNAAERNIIGYGMGAPTVVTHGSDDDKRRYLRPLFTGEEIWCQLFSEPGAGSDLAGLSTRAVRDGDEWVVSGQKVWTTVGHLARWGMLLTRSDPQQPKHRGLTYFILDMHAPGVEVRPLYQLTGEAEFNEVYLTDVRIPDSRRVGDEGDGWRVALTTLMNERVAIGGGVPPRGGGVVAELVKLWNAVGVDNPVARDRVLAMWVRAEVLRLTNIRAAQRRAAGVPGPEGSVGKLAGAELNKDLTELCVELLGAQGMLKPDGYPLDRTVELVGWRNPQQAFLRARANSIEGGTTEIMKNILGERVLGLPGDVRVDKDLPWAAVPRG